MTKCLTKILCLIFVSAILISTVSATDIITGTAAINPPDVEPCAGCTITVTVYGYWYELCEWNVTTGRFEPYNTDDITDLYYNGHSHTGTLSTYYGVSYDLSDGWEYTMGNWSSSNYEKRCPGSAIYTGVLTCSR